MLTTANAINEKGDNLCLYDPAKLATCDNKPFKPPFATCEKCLTKCVIDNLSDKDEAEATRWFYAYHALFEAATKEAE